MKTFNFALFTVIQIILYSSKSNASETCSSETKSCSRGTDNEFGFDILTQESNSNKTNSDIENSDPSLISETKPEDVKYDVSNVTYRELFRPQGNEDELYINSFETDAQYTDFYDFTLSDLEVHSLYKARSATYPTERFLRTNQGNFLHFFKVAFEKKLPVLFTNAALLDGLSHSVKRLQRVFYEEVLIHYIKRFADNMETFIANNKDKPKYKAVRFSLDSIQVFYSILSYLASNKIEEFTPRKDIEAEFNRWKNIVESYSHSDIFFLGKKKNVNYKYLSPIGFWKTTQRLQNIWQALAFLTIHRFHIEDEIKGIWLMGCLVDDAELGNHFNNISKMITYFKGQSSIIRNVVEISRIGRENGIREYILTPDDQKKLIELIKNNRTKPNITILDQMILWSKEQVEQIKSHREMHTHFLSEEYPVYEWIINKVTDYRKDNKRTMASIIEVNQAITGNKIKDTLLKNRMKGIKRTRYDTILKFRDFVDFKIALNSTETIIKNSMIKETEGWRSNLLNQFLLLSHYANKNPTKEEGDYSYQASKDPLYSSTPIREKNYNLGISSYITLFSDYKVFSKYIKSKTTEGEIPDIWVENSYEMYKESYEFVSRLEGLMQDFLNEIESAMRVNFRFVRNKIGKILQDMKYASKLCMDAVVMQEEKRMTEEFKNELKTLLYPEEISETWDGWFARLYDVDNQLTLFNFDSYAAFFMTTYPEEKEGFLGSNTFILNKFNTIGVTLVKDEQEKTEKLMLFGGNDYGEAYLKLDTWNFDILKESIINRSRNS